MKKHLFISIMLVRLCLPLSAQSTNDYRSIANGNWNDATKWEKYDGSSWVSTTSYPGQHAGAGLVTISNGTEIKITGIVAFPVSTVLTEFDIFSYSSLYSGILTFSAESAVSLTVTGDMIVYGKLGIENKVGTKTHSLLIGGNLTMGFWDYQSEPTGGFFESVNEDDRLHVIFNSEDPITISGPAIIPFYDVTFNCAGITLYETYITIAGNASFIRGIVTSAYYFLFQFNDGATVSNASNLSYSEVAVAKAGNDPFSFPIGNSNIYAPLTMSAPYHESVVLSASYKRANAELLGTIQDPGLYSVSNCEYWDFGGSNMGMPINITLGWNENSGCGSSPYISDVSKVTLALNVNYSWTLHGGSGTGTSSNGSVTWDGVTQFGKFTFGNLKPGCVAPYDYYTYSVTNSSATVKWGNLSGAISYDVDYKLHESSTWINAATSTVSNNLTISNLATGYYDWRIRANCSSLSSVYVQSSFTISPTNPPPQACWDGYEVNNTIRQARNIWDGNPIIYSGITTPNDIDWFKVTTPNNSYTNLVVTLSNLYADYDLYVYDRSNKLLGSSSKSGTANEVVIYNSIARKTTYFIKVIGKNGAFNPYYCYSLQALLSNLPTINTTIAPKIELMGDVDKQTLFPNPATSIVNVGFNSTVEGLAKVQILNSAGTLMKQSTVRITKGYNLVKVSVNDVRPGMYLIRMNKGEMNITRRFMKAE